MDWARQVLSGYPLDELIALLAPLPRYRSVQIFKWIARGVETFDGMSDLPLDLRGELSGRFTLFSSEINTQLLDNDGTIKLGITLADNAKIEAVLLSDGRDRKTACLSTQAGCPAGCVFCKTGTLGLKRNLSPAEIVEQFLLLKKAGGDISHIVIMGMGEPLLNLGNLRSALSVICDKQGINMSRRKITVSTCGISEGITELADRGPDVRLALSLTTADEELRRRLMPISQAQSLGSIKKALAHYQKKGGGRITLELVLLGGINTRPADVGALKAFVKGIDAVVNVIPWNSFDNPPAFAPALREPTRAETDDFMGQLEAAKIKATCRYRKGRGIGGACGQLG